MRREHGKRGRTDGAAGTVLLDVLPNPLTQGEGVTRGGCLMTGGATSGTAGGSGSYMTRGSPQTVTATGWSRLGRGRCSVVARGGSVVGASDVVHEGRCMIVSVM